tara:strand:- start:1074 stop:2033 length:960 start_codon:yes stop_codon:yes gene_type:complete
MKNMKNRLISVVVPLFNEEGNIPELYRRLSNVLIKSSSEYELIFIDDGSKDGSFPILKNIQQQDKRVKVIKFRKNFGQSAAMNAGFKHSQGEVIVSMDGDLQNFPEDIPRVLAKLDEGYGVVCGWRADRKDPLEKKLSSKFSNKLRRSLTKETIHDSGCSLKAYKKEALKEVTLYGEMHRYIPAIISQYGFKMGEVKVGHGERKHGKTKYGAGRLIRGFLDLMYIKFWQDYSKRPLHFFGSLGMGLMGSGFVLGVIKAITGFLHYLRYGETVVGPLLLASIFLIITGFLFIMFGFLAEIQIRLYYDTKKDIEIEKILGK